MEEVVIKNGVSYYRIHGVLFPTNHNVSDDWSSDEDCYEDPIVDLKEALGWSSDEECDDDQLIALWKAVRDDDTPKFVTKMNLLFDLDVKPYKIKPGGFCTDLILKWICSLGASTCATALLQGQTRVSVDLNVPCDLGRYPLHLAASALHYDLVKVFLSHGARTDIRNKHTKERNSLPINEAIKSLRNHEYLLGVRTPEESIYKLVITLCLPQMKEALETIKLLAFHTKDVNDVFIFYAREGKVVEMAVLLMTANEHIMAPSVLESKDSAIDEGNVSIRDIILGKIVLQANDDIFARAGVMATPALKFTLMLLNVFARAGDAIRSYLSSQQSQVSKEEVVKDVASILREAGFGLNDKDIDFRNIDCESNEIMEATRTIDDVVPVKPKECFSFFVNPSGEWFQWTKQGSAMKVFDPHWSTLSSPDGRRIGISQLLRFHETPRKGENYTMQRCMSTSKPSTLLLSLASSIKRGMRHI